MEAVAELSSDDFARAIGGDGVAVVYFWGTHCAPCRAMSPQFDRAATLRPRYRFFKQNINDHRRSSFELGIHSVPTVAVFGGGTLFGTRSGVLNAEKLAGVCDELVATAQTHGQA